VCKQHFQVEVFCVVKPYNIVVGYQRLRGPCCLRFHPEDGGSMGLWNVGILTSILHDVTARRPRLKTSQPWKLQKLACLLFKCESHQTIFQIKVAELNIVRTLCNVYVFLRWVVFESFDVVTFELLVESGSSRNYTVHNEVQPDELQCVLSIQNFPEIRWIIFTRHM
jgi:hypothetical protein